jgi:DNA-binding NarL/FixJ family response regulator
MRAKRKRSQPSAISDRPSAHSPQPTAHSPQPTAHSHSPLSALIRDRLGLTDQQAKVAAMLYEGLTEAAIAEALCVSADTVHYHRKQVYLRLDVHDQRTLMRRIFEILGKTT